MGVNQELPVYSFVTLLCQIGVFFIMICLDCGFLVCLSVCHSSKHLLVLDVLDTIESLSEINEALTNFFLLLLLFGFLIYPS